MTDQDRPTTRDRFHARAQLKASLAGALLAGLLGLIGGREWKERTIERDAAAKNEATERLQSEVAEQRVVIEELRNQIEEQDGRIKQLRGLTDRNHEITDQSASPPPSQEAPVSRGPEGEPVATKETAPQEFPEQKIESLRVSVRRFQVVAERTLRATLEFENVADQNRKIAVAMRAEGSDGIADFWKFMPVAIGSATDESGNVYALRSVSGLGFAREQDDWNFISGGTKIPVVVEYAGNAGLGRVFDLTFDIRLTWRDESGEQRSSAFTVFLPGLIAGRRAA
jgi:uncharacterized coiled-coil protein SlyX